MLPGRGKWVKIPLLPENVPRNPQEPSRGVHIIYFTMAKYFWSYGFYLFGHLVLVVRSYLSVLD